MSAPRLNGQPAPKLWLPQTASQPEQFFEAQDNIFAAIMAEVRAEMESRRARRADD